MKVVYFALIIAVIIIIFLNWFLPGNLTGGDSIFYFKEAYKNFSLHPYAWSTDRRAGLGETDIPLLWGYGINAFVVAVLGKIFGFDWSITYRLSFYFPFLIVSFLSAWYFAKKTVIQNTYDLIAGLIYTANTYILMVMAGGQANYGLGYALIPFVLYKFIALFRDIIVHLDNKKSAEFAVLLRSAIITGIILTLQIMLDIRVGYITLLAFGLFVLMNIRSLTKEHFIKKILLVAFLVFILPIGITILLLAYWILPTIVIGVNPVDQLGGGYTTIAGGIKFFSFAKLENTISLLHPNWPENIFGKVYFMRWEFLFIPIIAYSSLLFLKSKEQVKNQKMDNNVTIEQYNNKIILFFALLGLVGAFLAKGTNEPFGGIYLWFFTNVPGFDAFRDPTKWYAFIAVSYAVLIPYTIQQLTEYINKKNEKYSK